MIAPAGGISLDGERWVACRPGFFLPVRVLSRLFRRLFLEKLIAAHKAGHLKFFGNHAALADPQTFVTRLTPLRRTEWVVYAKRPFGGPEAVLAYLSRYTHRVAIANSRLIACDRTSVTFLWKDYRADGRQKVMTLATGEFIRLFLIHVLPHGFHRIRHYGLLASGTRADNIARARRLLDVPAAQPEAGDDSCAEANEFKPPAHPCPCCGGRMAIIETFERGCSPRYRPAASPIVIRIDTS
jgi:putative transposase